ncbi:hypothetical protein A2801_03305 [Candidatus Woesebacteria bacterium RIFCSPHIGHO2_01_FULL_41_10]|uniref:Uncharacterized protein n=1 Tax=Candidatus Woesebacteria bacterium RIFCSPHIGHO2_01_FULL_41_10 TaxID=1802500 RepID=A0A1F7YUL8_9BACT|nr:MAG: hypothetical protein A2801_03305 [Candidatus Woesebacteria bacterium RIFCSPHIGHO2_01_FULL_41_10]
MSIPTDPQFLYMILVLPTLFGLTLVGEGLTKVVHHEWHGLISLLFGIAFIGVVVFAFFFFSTYLQTNS